MSRPVLYALAVSAFLLTSCNHLQQMGTHRQIGPIKSGDAYIIRTSSQETQVYALALREVTDTTAALEKDSSRHLFTIGTDATVSIFHDRGPPFPFASRTAAAADPGSNPLLRAALNLDSVKSHFIAPMGSHSTSWIAGSCCGETRAVTSVPDGEASWNVTVTAPTMVRVREIVAQLASFHSTRLHWPDPAVTPPTSHVDHMLLRGQAHCPPARGMSRGGHR